MKRTVKKKPKSLNYHFDKQLRFQKLAIKITHQILANKNHQTIIGVIPTLPNGSEIIL